MAREAMVDIPLRGPPELKEALQREALRQGHTLSHLARVMLRDGLRRLRDGEELIVVERIGQGGRNGD